MINRLFPLLYFTAAALLLTGCNKNYVRISGSLSSPVPGEYIFLDELKSNKLEPVDSLQISDKGTFSFKRKVTAPSFYLLKLKNNNFMTLLVVPGEELILKAHHDSLNYPYSVEGSAGTMKLAEYNSKLRSTIGKMSALNKIYAQNEHSPQLPSLMESIDSMAQGYLNELNAYTKNYIDENIGSLVSLVARYQQIAPGVYVLNPSRDWKYFVKVDSSMFRKYPEYDPVITLHNQVKELVATMSAVSPSSGERKGSEVPEISLPTPQGDTIKLSSTRGSVVLLDFWASWCGPCRMENPNLVKAYDQYHRKGFQIFQVSLDKTKEAWIKGIQDDKLGRWIHVSDVQYWKSVVVPLYKIESIPANYLLDRDGRIIAVNLRGDRLQQKLADVFDSGK
jgi:thiol-disulfide isomerase/thioredoxin